MQTNATNSSGYMLIFRESGPDTYKVMSREQKDKLLSQWNEWYEGLASQGKVSQGHPLQPVGRVVYGAQGERVVDGPFAEGKEAVGGFFFLTVSDLDEATAIAKQCPGLPYGLTVEVRPVAPTCPGLSSSKLQSVPELARV